MAEPRPIYRTDGQWMALVYQDHLFDTAGEWVGWLDGADVYSVEGEYVGYISDDGRLLRQRVLTFKKRRRSPGVHPQVKIPQTVPLAPMFAELSYSLIDVLEEKPELFATIHELRADSGERPLQRLVETDPHMATQHKLRKMEQDILEQMVYGLIYSYGATEPPVPIEAMVAGVEPNMACEIETASPRSRVRLAEEFIERLGHSTWAMQRDYCGPEGFKATQIRYAARALLLPRHWIASLPQDSLKTSTLAQRCLVPEAAAVLRLHDLE